MIGVRDQVGAHQVCWMQDIDESTREATRGLLEKYRGVPPTDCVLLFAWSGNASEDAVGMRKIEDEGGFYYAYLLHDGWHDASPERRE